MNVSHAIYKTFFMLSTPDFSFSSSCWEMVKVPLVRCREMTLTTCFILHTNKFHLFNPFTYWCRYIEFWNESKSILPSAMLLQKKNSWNNLKLNALTKCPPSVANKLAGNIKWNPSHYWQWPATTSQSQQITTIHQARARNQTKWFPHSPHSAFSVSHVLHDVLFRGGCGPSFSRHIWLSKESK